jgi:microcompartment protein CcmL/EutN
VAFTAAVALLEFSSIAAGIEAGDAMVKRAALEVIHTGTVHPGKYLILIGGSVGDIEEALDAALMVSADHVVDRMFLPDPHPHLLTALTGARQPGGGEALGIIETVSVAAAIRAADAGLKGAVVTLREIFMADGLGGKGYLLFGGPLVEVEAAVELGCQRAAGALIGSRVIAQLHDEMDENLVADGRFSARVRAG